MRARISLGKGGKGEDGGKVRPVDERTILLNRSRSRARKTRLGIQKESVEAVDSESEGGLTVW